MYERDRRVQDGLAQEALSQGFQDGALGLERHGDNDCIGALGRLLVEAAVHRSGDALSTQAPGCLGGAVCVAGADEHRLARQAQPQGQPHALRSSATQES